VRGRFQQALARSVLSRGGDHTGYRGTSGVSWGPSDDWPGTAACPFPPAAAGQWGRRTQQKPAPTAGGFDGWARVGRGDRLCALSLPRL